tara:strand:+ start:734 stop:1036 length:303 start_codon:yes stop_codon:yes gene_type:complete
MQIALIADQDTINGLMLAGVKHSAIFNPDNVEEKIQEFSKAKILVFTEKVGQYLRENNLISTIGNTYLEIPDKSGSSGQAMKKINELFENAIGIVLKEDE